MDDCMTCAACCFSESPRHVRVTGDDHARLGDDAERLVVFLGNQAFMRLAGDPGAQRCAALVLTGLGTPQDRSPTEDHPTFACSVYERRPQICRDLERGSGACEGERAAKRGRSKRALLVLARPPIGARS